jgi:hypothetical protein
MSSKWKKNVSWNEEKFESLHKDAPKIANPLGWRRPNEFWIRPDAWRSIFDNIAEMAVPSTDEILSLVDAERRKGFPREKAFDLVASRLING